RTLSFPDRWQVDNLTSAGFEKPGMASEEIKNCIENPIEGPTLDELARGKKQAVIVFDDMTRPTPVKAIAAHVLSALHRAGMKKEQIRFLWALGSHGTHDMIAARKKLGDEIVENYAVYNHDAFQNTVHVGRTPTGVELWFNRGFMDCDLKIGIGCISAHVHVGFGGGAKIILPGVAGIESINQFHNQLYRDPSRTGLGNFDGNIMREECDAAGDLVGLNFKIDCLVNRRGEINGLYAGPFRATHAQGGEEGKEHYGIRPPRAYDIVVSNAYGKANEAAVAIAVARMVMKPKTAGTCVLIVDAPEGQVPHYVFRSWGTEHGGRHYNRRVKGFVTSIFRKMIVLNPLPTPVCLDWIGHIDEVDVVKTWPEALAILEADYPGAAEACVIQDATVQYIIK
ncbi:MAG: lactate racemase domain-containing protein, partial [Syntrophales bacterium]|nr:lactate racemase domain-containing protein [Syntrophales bacterium]